MKRALLLLILFATPLAAQEDTTRVPSGVRLGLIYQTAFRPKVAVRPFDSPASARETAAYVHSIIARDLDYSDRFDMFDVPDRLREGAVDYPTWNALGVVFLVTGEVVPDPDAVDLGYRLRLTLHDVVYGSIKENRSFPIPSAGDPDFRMAVHAAADELVLWATGQPGIAASRILFVRRAGDRYDLMAVDSDGENVRRITGSDEEILYSPAWAPDGSRIAYSAGRVETGWVVRERDLRSGAESVVSAQPGLNMTPSYSPDGKRLAFAVSAGSGTDIHDFDLERRCCLRRLSRGPLENISPSYSPDGRRIAFMSDRLGQPHIYVMPADGGETTILSPFVYGEPGYYTSPEWAPVGELIAFHGRSRGGFQIMVADASRPGAIVQQITSDGVSEDPSWAPNGRHLVFTGVRAQGVGLYVIDSVTGRVRPLVLGGRYMMPDWSPPLVRASALAVRGAASR